MKGWEFVDWLVRKENEQLTEKLCVCVCEVVYQECQITGLPPLYVANLGVFTAVQ